MCYSPLQADINDPYDFSTNCHTDIICPRQGKKEALVNRLALVVGTGYFLVVTSLFPTVCLLLQTVFSNKNERVSHAVLCSSIQVHYAKASECSSACEHGHTLKQRRVICVWIYWAYVESFGQDCMVLYSYRSHGVGVQGHQGHFLFPLKRCRALTGDKRDHGSTSVACRI